MENYACKTFLWFSAFLGLENKLKITFAAISLVTAKGATSREYSERAVEFSESFGWEKVELGLTDRMETEGTAGAKSFLIRDLLSDLIVKNPENEEASDNESGK
jgi:hypothetical protein